MTEVLTAERLTDIVKGGSMEECIAYLAQHSLEQRRSLGRVAVALFKEWEKEHFQTIMDGKHRTDVRLDVARVAVLATGSLAQVKSCGWNICLPETHMIEVLSKFYPEWLDLWVEHLLRDSPFNFGRLRCLWETGLCEKPTGELYVLGLIVAARHAHWPDKAASPGADASADIDPLSVRLRRHPELAEDLWQFFEIEGHGEFSLAAYDKYCAAPQTWATALHDLSAAGVMDRDRLLDACLDALARDFAQFRAGWFSRFYESLDPTIDEQIARKKQLLRLLGSAIPPTVSLALKAIKTIDAASPFGGLELLDAVQSVVQARQKGAVSSALRLVEAAAERAPEIRFHAITVAQGALIHDAADVQRKALQLMEKLGVADEPELRQNLSDYADGVAPSLRAQFATLCDVQDAPKQSDRAQDFQPPRAIEPITSYDEFVSEFLRLLEDTSDPVRIERLVDGLARHGADMPVDFERAMGPLSKRASQILNSAGDTTLRFGLAHLAHCYAKQIPPDLPERLVFGSAVSLGWSHRKTPLGPQSFITVFMKRNADVLRQVQHGRRLPMLCRPTDDRGFIAPEQLVKRVLAYEDAEAEPGQYDLCLALMRLAPEGRDAAKGMLTGRGEIADALLYALGGPLEPAVLKSGASKPMWIAASAGRLPREDAPAIAKLSGLTAPDVGVRARIDVTVSTACQGKYVFPEINVTARPEIKKPVPDSYLAGLFHLTTAGQGGGSICGHTADDIRWSSLVWPQNLEPFFAQGIDVLDLDQKLSKSPYAAFIEPMLMPHVAMGPLATLLLSQSMASADPAVHRLAAEILITAIEEDRLSATAFGDATRDLMVKAALPTGRWTRAFSQVTGVSTSHAVFLCAVGARLLRFDPETPPRDFGGMLELLYELHVDTKARFSDEKARSCLSAISAGGKLGKFAKRLLDL